MDTTLNGVAVVVMLVGMFALYIFPTIVAGSRGHHNTAAIFILNLFLGWTLLGWVGALVWAATAVTPKPQAPARPNAPMF